MSGKSYGVQKNVSDILEMLIVCISCLLYGSNLVFDQYVWRARSNLRFFAGSTKRFGILEKYLEKESKILYFLGKK